MKKYTAISFKSSESTGFQPVKKSSLFSFQCSESMHLGPRAASPLLECTTYPALECGAPRKTIPGSRTASPLLFILLLLFSATTFAETLQFSGTIGNTGESGKSLVHFSDNRSPKFEDGLGVVYDKYGTLWSTAGLDQVNRYALDGRFINSYKVPNKSRSHMDRMIDCGDTIIFLLRDELYSLSIDAKPGSEAVKIDGKYKVIGFTEMTDKFPAVNEKEELVTVGLDGKETVITKLGKMPFFLFMQKDGTVNLAIDGRFRTVKNCKLIEDENAPKLQGDAMQKFDNNWYVHAWHGTIKRYDESIAPDPGIVLGGSSGSFIGHLIGNYELNRGRAMAKINNNLFAVGGAGNVIHLMEWKEKETRFELVRRIGSLAEVNGSLALDSEGRILVPYGNWNWDDAPGTPLRNSTGRAGNGQVAFMDNSNVVTGSLIYGNSPAWSYGEMTGELKSYHDSKKVFKFQNNVSGLTVLKKEGKIISYYLNGKGEGHRLHIDGEGKPKEYLGTFKMTTNSPVKKWTSFAKVNNDKIIAAGDGFVIEFDASGSTEWKELKRWKNFTSDSFGNEIHISIDKDYFWVADTERHRILCFDHNQKLIATYGEKDTVGDDLQHFKKPTTIFGNSHRVVVYDEGNQRLMKFEVK